MVKCLIFSYLQVALQVVIRRPAGSGYLRQQIRGGRKGRAERQGLGQSPNKKNKAEGLVLAGASCCRTCHLCVAFLPANSGPASDDLSQSPRPPFQGGTSGPTGFPSPQRLSLPANSGPASDDALVTLRTVRQARIDSNRRKALNCPDKRNQ